ncbi:MAG: hypothetical protein R3202_01840 [Candidatus Competibacterales bacterium]|nr:hypothetical protein [Candidatus Competibacterales bacterium]
MPFQIREPQIEPYWKLPQLQIVQFSASVTMPSVERAVYSVLESSDHIASGWTVKGPLEYAAGGVRFSGWYHKPADFAAMLEAADFELRWLG